jgi:hypothetical protein
MLASHLKAVYSSLVIAPWSKHEGVEDIKSGKLERALHSIMSGQGIITLGSEKWSKTRLQWCQIGLGAGDWQTLANHKFSAIDGNKT